MIITSQTAYGFVILLFNSVLAGIALSVLHLLVNIIPSIVLSSKVIKDGYGVFREQVRSYRGSEHFFIASDFLICIIAACLLCSLAFIYNEGQFRIISVILLSLGFHLGKSLFGKLFDFPITVIAFVALKTVYFVSLPFAAAVKLLFRLIRCIVTKTVAARRLSLMKKYTKERFDKLGAVTEFGLVDEGYKELIK